MYTLTAPLTARLPKLGNLYRSNRVIKPNFRLLIILLYIQILILPNLKSTLINLVYYLDIAAPRRLKEVSSNVSSRDLG